MNRRDFVYFAGSGLLSTALWPRLGFSGTLPSVGPWRTLELTTQVFNEDPGAVDIWLPMPLEQSSYQQLLNTTWDGNFSKAEVRRDGKYGASIFHAHWNGSGKKELTLSHRLKVQTRQGAEPLGSENLALYLEATEHIALDGVVLQTSRKIVGTKQSKDDEKARLIYDWVVTNSVRDPKVRGCGAGDLKTLLSSGTVAGKCADLSSLFVGLCRASGIPAREVFGIRVAPSSVSKSLGKELGDVSKAQHCRAEFYSAAKKGWIAVDPADVRKVMLEENLPLTDAHVREVSARLFGSWDMNWIAYNSARDFNLLAAPAPALNYLMYPLLTAQNGATEIDGREPEKFKYSIVSKAV